MAIIKFTTPDDKLQRDLDANCKHYGYREMISDAEGNEIPNPQAKQDFIEEVIKRQFKETSKAQRTQDAVKVLIIEE